MSSDNVDDEQFGPDPALVGFWILLAGLPIPLAIYDCTVRGWSLDMFELLVGSMLIPCMLLIFALRFRIYFSNTAVTYRSWGKTISMPSGDIDRIEVGKRTPIAKGPVSVVVIMDSGESHPIWLKIFPGQAIERFMAIGKVRE